jgi:hypothetical protein
MTYGYRCVAEERTARPPKKKKKNGTYRSRGMPKGVPCIPVGIPKSERNSSGSHGSDGRCQQDLETVQVDVVHRELESEKDAVDDGDRD